MAGLLFIAHDTSDGRTGAHNRSLISAHTLRHNRLSKRDARSSGYGNGRTLTLAACVKSPGRSKRQPKPYVRGFDAHASSVAARGSEHATDGASLPVDLLQLRVEGLIVAAPAGFTAYGQDGEDVQSIGQWYFLNHLYEDHASYFHHAQNHWTNGIWEMARVNQSMFAGIVALASYREVALAKRCSESFYLERKGRAIRRIDKDLSRRHSRTDPLTLVAIALLAYMDLRDNQFHAARIHLYALCKLVNIAEMSTYAWLYCVWIDLRYALLTCQSPMLPYHIPTSLRQSYSSRVSVNLWTVERASSNVAHCPQTSCFDHHKAFDLFNKLHALCLCSDQLDDSDDPPFGWIYDLEYTLRVLQSQVCEEDSQCHPTAATELVVLAAQLHVWMACRFWTPQSRGSHLAFVSRASLIINTLSGRLVRWDDHASARSLLWVLFTMIAMMRIYGDANLMCALDLLHSTLATLGISSCEGFSATLTEWPWISDWHPVQLVHIWTMLTGRFDDLMVMVPNTCHVAVQVAPSRPPQRFFLGGLEFFNTL
ncbi:hypothetical protein Q7P36_007778 [Cladosporium allicinum]